MKVTFEAEASARARREGLTFMKPFAVAEDHEAADAGAVSHADDDRTRDSDDDSTGPAKSRSLQQR